MRILHFSDFHLNGENIDKAQAVLDYMIEALESIKQDHKIDLVLFSGDMLDQGGRGFHDMKEGFEKFHEIVITPLMACLNLPESRFIFTPGNHDIDRQADNKFTEEGIENHIKSCRDIIQIVDDKDTVEATHRIDTFKTFEKEYYSRFSDVGYTFRRFSSTFEMDVDGLSIGIASLNTVWRCGFDDTHKIVMGLNQITEQSSSLKGKQIRIALTHYPISCLKDIEQLEVKQKCAENFDLFFCGHSHRGYTFMQAPSKDKAFCEINTSGSLVANIYEENYAYKNAFQIIDCESGVKYVVKCYVQRNFQEFTLDKNFGTDGINELIVPNAEQIKAIYEQQCKELEKREEELRRREVYPFVLVQDYLNNSGASIQKYPFVRCEGIDKCIAQLRNGSGNFRLMALSGMGKTRIVFEAFKDLENVYYSNSPDCLKGLEGLLREFSPTAVVIDNCNEQSMNDAVKYLEQVGSQARLITIYNVMTPEEKAINGSLLELTYAVTEEVVDKMLQTANIPEEKRDIVQAIKDRSGNIPYMALLLIEAYKKKGNLQIENSDAVLSTILRGSGELTEQRLDVLRAISLFEPLGKDLGVSDEYDYVRKHCRIHNVNLRQDIVDNEFENTINDYEGRQLMEHEGSCIRIRPRPLAEWLTESWLKKYGSKIADIVDDINQQEEGLKRRLFRALDKRITGMPASKFTQQLFDELNNPQTGAFHNERIAFSKAGSQLFLSMGLVSPVMVAKNLYDLLSSKSTVWLRGYLDGDARRNLVWALENVCHSDEAFDDAAKSLGILAVAENEEIANNATGLFVQLFHLYLSGTKANLKQRITLLQSMCEKEANFPLLLNAIDHAFMTGHFYRSNTNGLPDANDDYQPQVSEILFYWRDCAIVLKEITNQDNNLLEAMKEKFPKHISDLARFGAKDILFDILNFVGEKCNYDWMAARDSLASYLEFSFKGTDAYRAEFQTMLDKFAPKTFLGKLSSFVKDNHCRIGEDYAAYAQLMTERMKPFAEEFLKKRIFEHNDFLEILQDKEMNQIWFIRALAELTKNNDSQMELFQGMLRWVLTFPKEYAGNFIPTYIRIIGKNEIVLSFLGVIEHEGYYRLSASVIGVLDDKTFTGLLNLISKYHNGQYDDDGINQYLRMYNYQSLLDVFKIFDILHNGGVNEKAVGYPFLVDHLNYINLDELRKVRCLEKYKEILLNFDFKESSGYLNRQIVEAFGDVLRESSNKNFAFSIHQRIMDVLVKLDYIDNPFDNIYFTLLPKYQDVVLDDLLAKLGSSDSLLAYRMSLYLNLGSGLGSGKGPLFQCDIERLKEACFKYSDYLPARLANMCPVYEYTDKGKQDSFSKFFLWLCDNFGNQKQMLDEFSANMGTFSWCGVDGFSSFIAQRIPCIQPLLEHKNPTVREWAKEQLEAVRNEVMREQGQEAYERMIRG